MEKTAVLGFGNPCRSDDAIGIYVIEQLHRQFASDHRVSLFDMGTSAFEVLFKLKGHSKIILVDAVVNTGEPPGTRYKLPAHAVERAVVEDPMVFLHSLKWDQALSYARKIMGDEYPNDIGVYLIAVDDTSLDLRLSDEVREAGDDVVARIARELEVTYAE